jgi:hypothetical protein
VTQTDVKQSASIPSAPVGWRVVQTSVDGAMYRRHDGLKVIYSTAIEADNRIWLHVSLSRRGRLPTYADMTAVKHLFVGDELTAYQVFPAKCEHVNYHPYCLHMFALVNGERGLPDFTRGGPLI